MWKWLTVPKQNTTKEVQTVQLWVVEWTSRHGKYSWDTKQEFEAFTSKEEAEAFKLSLENAYRLVKHSSGIAVKISKN